MKKFTKWTPSISIFPVIILLLLIPVSLTAQSGEGQQLQITGDVVFPNPDGLSPSSEVSGELKQWHKVTLTIDGPTASQYGQTVYLHDEESGRMLLDVRPQAGPSGRYTSAHPNPFMDYRMTVTFTHESGTPSYTVPGYFAADGNAAETSASSGNKWRAHLSPDKAGSWTWDVGFVAGVGIAVDETREGEPYMPYHGMSGSFEVAESDKALPDFRARGRLTYVGEHYLQFAGDNTFFIKAGADSPETLLAYAGFDGTTPTRDSSQGAWIGPESGSGLHEYAPHIQDWEEGDPVWQSGKGRGLIGAANYLSSKGVNSMSFIPYNAGGDGDNVWPFVSRNQKFNYHVAKLDQWEIFFAHAQSKGIFLHFKLQEIENAAGYPYRIQTNPNATVPESLDGGLVGPERKLYTRELIARFGHHLALNWNMSEETSMMPEHLSEWSRYIRDVDPYGHHIVLHTYPGYQEVIYRLLLGEQSEMTGASVQIGYDDGHQETLQWIRESREAGKPWAVAFDEQGGANLGVPPDMGYRGWTGLNAQGNPVTSVDDIRKYSLWGNLMAGGWGVEYYFGYTTPHNDLVTEDFRSRDSSWDYARHALEFFSGHDLPLTSMENCNALVGNTSDDNSRYCFAADGEVYLVYLPDGGTSTLNLEGVSGEFDINWYDPRNGGNLQSGSVVSVQGGEDVTLGNPPDSPDQDWLIVVKQ